ncbi:MAG: AAA family ATPase [Candidatus Electrothrix scaldis]|nr:MAG: AAA family ATPase [Candidatus Electrothrix sp. GW3-3]
MSGSRKIFQYPALRQLATRLRDDLNNRDFVLLYAYNGTGKTRLSMEFKDAGKRKNRGNPDTLYFNAFTEDLFIWDNDLEGDSERVLQLNSASLFFSGIKELALEENIQAYLGRYADFDFDIDYERWAISFRKGEQENIKVSRGEENVFIWCLFMAICERVFDGDSSYAWVKYIYIDDPISSLDDNNAIAVASDLAKLLRRGKDQFKVVISSHHSLFFNVVCNELKKQSHKKYFLHRPNRGSEYTLRSTDETPFFHHVAMLSELQKAADSGTLYTYHFNMLRSILEKTAIFFGHDDFSTCIHGVEDEVLYARALNLLSHGKYAIYEPREMVEDTKQLFCQILNAFLNRYQFALPEVLAETSTSNSNS